MEGNKLGTMPISKLIWNMSLPIIVSMLVQALYNIVDSVFVSRICEQALTAVSLAFPAQNLMIGLATGTAVGVNALMGRALGAGERERANHIATNGVFLAGVGFAICAILAAFFARMFFAAQTSIDYIVDNGATRARPRYHCGNRQGAVGAPDMTVLTYSMRSGQGDMSRHTQAPQRRTHSSQAVHYTVSDSGTNRDDEEVLAVPSQSEPQFQHGQG